MLIDQRISVLTIATKDLTKMKDFYENTFGWISIAGNKDIVFYKFNGFLLSLCDRKTLSDFIEVDYNNFGINPVTFGYNVESEEKVLFLYNKLKGKVKILKEPTKPPFGGLFFYFFDIENNIIEIACNSFITLDKNNNAIDHDSIDNL